MFLISISFLGIKANAYENKICNSLNIDLLNKFCYNNYYAISSYDNHVSLISVYKNNWDLIFKTDDAILWTSIEAAFVGWKILYVYESKYWNHIFIDNSYFVEKYDFEWKPINIDYNYYDKIIKEKDLWVYIDWKKVFDYATSKEKYVYNSFSNFINDSWIYACDDKENCIWKKYDTWIYLSEKIRERLDRFIEKIDEKKYDKEKILKKLEVLYKKFKNWKTYKSRFYTEVIIYLYSEITINKLKQQEKLEKISFYN